jgi:phosphoribosylanthranilate isomerase
MRIRVKICGITDGDGLHAAVDAGAHAVGFVLAESPRQVSVDRAARLVAMTPAFVTRVAVLRHPSDALLRDVVDVVRPDRIQLEIEDVARLPAAAQGRAIPVFHDDDTLLERIAARVPRGGTIHLEGPGRGGRGIPVDPERAVRAADRVRLILAGCAPGPWT